MTEILSAPAKINWFLAVGQVRPADGRHELLSCFQILRNPGDRIFVDFEAERGISVECDLPGIPSGTDNLAGRAAQLFAEKAKITPFWSIRIEKHIPAAAGMGGGSSDAGTLLRALNRRYPVLSGEQLNALALSIGADVPLFIRQEDAVGRGAGEILSSICPRLKFPPVLVVFPGFPVSARWAYQNFSENPHSFANAQQELEKLLEAAGNCYYETMCRYIRNDLAEALFKKFPMLTILREKLLSCGALHVEISGSGPSLFAVFPDCGSRTAAGRELAVFCRNISGMKIIETDAL